MPYLSKKTNELKQSAIRSTTKNCLAHGGINLGQGICDIPIPEKIKEAAYQAIATDKSVYSACEGISALREGIAKKVADFNGFKVDAELEVLVTHGSTGAFVCALTTLFNPGDEIILFEPFYGYHRNIAKLQGIGIKTVPINLADLTIDFDQLDKVINERTKGMVICTPNNPTGKVYTFEELNILGKIAEQHDLIIITDEIYEYITYPGYQHLSIASLEKFKQRTITISGFSKTYNMTGWRLGYAVGPAAIIEKMALVQDLLYVCPTTPLQHAVMTALQFPDRYYQDMRQRYLQKRDLVLSVLKEIGLPVTYPQGAYYMIVDVTHLNYASDQMAADDLLAKTKVAMVPGSAFFENQNHQQQYLRLCYALDEKYIQQAMDQFRNYFLYSKQA